MSMLTDGAPIEAEVVNYVPDEVCVVVESDNTSRVDEGAFYAHVRSELNRVLTALIATTEPERKLRPDSFEQDLEPVVLRQRFSGERAPFQPFRGRGRATVRDVVFSVPLPHARSGRTTRHMYFSLGTDAVRLNESNTDRRARGIESVREVVLLLNRAALSITVRPFKSVLWSIKAIAPNWLTFAFPFGCGSPAGIPVPAGPERHRWRFRFRGRLARALGRADRARVIVAVLDTCPQQKDVDASATMFRRNSLLGEVQHKVKMNQPPLVPDPTLGPHLAGCLPRWQWDMRSGLAQSNPDTFAMADHGLFVTGIVVDIVPAQTLVHLIRVLNDYGVGDLFAITTALAELPRRLLGSDEPRPDEARLVVNLSLGIDLPIPPRLLDRWLPRTAHDPEVLGKRQADIAEIFESLHGNLADTVDFLTERGVLVVAATGNDALRKDVPTGDPPPPRLPARYDHVLAVAATRRDLDTPADYSNRGELTVATWPGDVSTFGGNVKAGSADNEPSVTEADDSIVGIFSSPTLPGGQANTTGWVRWAGTSFATPIVSAVAARLWSADPSLTPSLLIALLRTFTRHPHGGADPDSRLEVPRLDTTQA